MISFDQQRGAPDNQPKEVHIMKKAIVLGLALLSPFALADDGPTIDGGVQLNVQAQEDINAAVGNEAVATQELGSIESGTMTGDIEMEVEATGDINAAVGNKSCADQAVGAIGHKSTC